jgi:hypothetical protein
MIEKAVADRGRGRSLTVLCLKNSDEVTSGIITAAFHLHSRGPEVTIVDLTDAGTVASAVARHAGGSDDGTPAVFRPSVVPSLAEGPTRIEAGRREDTALTSGKNRLTLALADFDPAIGVDHLSAWTDSVIVAVTAGRSSVELVRTAGDLIRSAGLRLRGALLLHAVGDDLSSGVGLSAADVEADPDAAASAAASSVGRSG